MSSMASQSNRIIGTVVALFGWFAFIVLYLAFYAEGFDFGQKVAVFLASGAIVIAIIAVVWIKSEVKT